MLLLFTEHRGQWNHYNININIQISFGIHNFVCNVYYAYILVQGKRHCSAERRGAWSCWGLLFIHWFIMWPLKRHLVILQFNISLCRKGNNASTQTVPWFLHSLLSVGVVEVTETAQGQGACLSSPHAQEAQRQGTALLFWNVLFFLPRQQQGKFGLPSTAVACACYLTFVMNNDLPWAEYTRKSLALKRTENNQADKAEHKGKKKKSISKDESHTAFTVQSSL